MAPGPTDLRRCDGAPGAGAGGAGRRDGRWRCPTRARRAAAPRGRRRRRLPRSARHRGDPDPRHPGRRSGGPPGGTLPVAPSAGDGWHGRGLPRRAGRRGVPAARGDQVDAGRAALGRCRGAVPARAPDPGLARSSEHRAAPRWRGQRWRAVSGDGARGGHPDRRILRGRETRYPCHHRALPRRLRCRGPRPSQSRGPPRPEARQHPGHRRRRGEAARLRRGETARRGSARGAGDGGGAGTIHSRLCQSRTTSGGAALDCLGCLFAGRSALSPAHRPLAARPRGAHPLGDRAPGHRGGPGAPERVAAGIAGRPRHHPAQGTPSRTRATLPVGQRPCRRPASPSGAATGRGTGGHRWIPVVPVRPSACRRGGGDDRRGARDRDRDDHDRHRGPAGAAPVRAGARSGQCAALRPSRRRPRPAGSHHGSRDAGFPCPDLSRHPQRRRAIGPGAPARAGRCVRTDRRDPGRSAPDQHGRPRRRDVELHQGICPARRSLVGGHQQRGRPTGTGEQLRPTRRRALMEWQQRRGDRAEPARPRPPGSVAIRRSARGSRAKPIGVASRPSSDGG